MSNELKNELKVELSCGRCNFTKVISIGLDTDGVFTIPNKFCPNDLSELEREVLRNFVSEPKKPDEPKLKVELDGPMGSGVCPETKLIIKNEPTEDKTRTSNAVPGPARPVDVPKHGTNRPKKT